MNIKQAKQEITNTLKAYLAKEMCIRDRRDGHHSQHHGGDGGGNQGEGQIEAAVQGGLLNGGDASGAGAHLSLIHIWTR